MVRRLFVLCALLTGCHLDVDYTGTSYRCSVTSDCPSEQACRAGICRTTDGATGADAAEPNVSDAGPDAPPPDAGPPPNLLPDPSFESGVDGWIGYLGTASSTSTNPHSGTHALRVCKDDIGHDGFFSVYRDLIVDRPDLVPVGAHFRAEAWVRAFRNPNDIAPSFLSPMLRERGGPSPFFNHFGPSLDNVTPAWTLITAEGVVTDGGRTALSFVLEAGTEPDGTCFAIDDVYIYRVD